MDRPERQPQDQPDQRTGARSQQLRPRVRQQPGQRNRGVQRQPDLDRAPGGDGGEIAVDNTTSPPTLYRDHGLPGGSTANTSFFQQSINGGLSWTNDDPWDATATDNGGSILPWSSTPSNPIASWSAPTGSTKHSTRGRAGADQLPEDRQLQLLRMEQQCADHGVAIAPDPTPNTSTPRPPTAISSSRNSTTASTWAQRDVTIGSNYIGGPETQSWSIPTTPYGLHGPCRLRSGTDAGHVFMSTNGGQPGKT